MTEPACGGLQFSLLPPNLCATGDVAILLAFPVSLILVAIAWRIAFWQPVQSRRSVFNVIYLWLRTWTEQQTLQLTVVMGLAKGLTRIRGMRRALTEEDQKKIAEAIIKELQTSHWKITRGPPLGGGAAHIAGKE